MSDATLDALVAGLPAAVRSPVAAALVYTRSLSGPRTFDQRKQEESCWQPVFHAAGLEAEKEEGWNLRAGSAPR